MDPEVLALNAHSELCVNQAYCLNGGTCYRLTALGRIYCQCAESFEGERCHVKTVNIPDLDESKHYGEIRLSLERMLPVVIVVAVALVLMVVLFCFYVCAKKCHQRYCNPSAVKVLIYQNASAQTSISQLCLLGGDHYCNGHLASGLTNSARTRLIACSATPDDVDSNLQELHNSNRSFLDVESGCRTDDDLIEPVHVSKNPSIVLTLESDAAEALRDTRRGGTEQGINAAEESAPRRFQCTINSQEAATRCLASNDSNNNNDVFACSSSRQATDPVTANCDEKTWHSSKPGDSMRDNCVKGSDSANTKDANDDLCDSDPEATAL